MFNGYILKISEDKTSTLLRGGKVDADRLWIVGSELLLRTEFFESGHHFIKHLPSYTQLLVGSVKNICWCDKIISNFTAKIISLWQ